MRESHSANQIASRFRNRYLLLTLGFLLPLGWAFVRVTNVYPVASWNVMSRGGQIPETYTYYVLRGETASGEVIDIPAVTLTNALRSRLWGLVTATANNDSFKLRSPNSRNVARLGTMRPEELPPGLLMSDLLRAWGKTYNDRHPSPSPYHLKAIRIDSYQWSGGSYSNYEQFIRSWREEL